MPGLTLNTGTAAGAAASSSSAPAPPAGTTNPMRSNSAIPPPALPIFAQSQPPPQPQPRAHLVQPPPPPAPAPAPPTSQQQPSKRSSTPPPQQSQQQQQHPPVSPITPPLNPTPPRRPTLTHTSQPTHTDRTALPGPPPPEPLDFDTNPDVLALRSALAVLQNQRRRAAADMVALDRARAAALAEPEAFLSDLTSGRVGMAGAGGGSGDLLGGHDDGDDDDSDTASSISESDSDDAGEEEEKEEEDSDEEMKDAAGPGEGEEETQIQIQALPRSTLPTAARRIRPKKPPLPRVTKGGDPGPSAPAPGPASAPPDITGHRPPPPPRRKNNNNKRPWSTLPGKQSVVRCPPINWAQYAVVGESLDKLHGEQQGRPAQGAPAVLTADGRYEFQGDGGGGQDGRYLGVAAPYDPLRDRLPAKKTRGSRR